MFGVSDNSSNSVAVFVLLLLLFSPLTAIVGNGKNSWLMLLLLFLFVGCLFGWLFVVAVTVVAVVVVVDVVVNCVVLVDVVVSCGCCWNCVVVGCVGVKCSWWR